MVALFTERGKVSSMYSTYSISKNISATCNMVKNRKLFSVQNFSQVLAREKSYRE